MVAPQLSSDSESGNGLSPEGVPWTTLERNLSIFMVALRHAWGGNAKQIGDHALPDIVQITCALGHVATERGERLLKARRTMLRPRHRPSVCLLSCLKPPLLS